MKRIIIILFVLLPLLPVNAQVQLRLDEDIDLLKFFDTTVVEAYDVFGKPTSVRHHMFIAPRCGMRYDYMMFNYTDHHVQLRCNHKRNSGLKIKQALLPDRYVFRKKWITTLILSPSEKITLNGLPLTKITEENHEKLMGKTALKMLSEGSYRVPFTEEVDWVYHFYFDEQGELESVRVSMYLCRIDDIEHNF